jgi:hypothetical protein
VNKLGKTRSANISGAFVVLVHHITVIYHITLVPNVTINGKYFLKGVKTQHLCFGYYAVT